MKPFRIVLAVAVVAIIGVIALVVIQNLRSDDANLATEAPAIPTSASTAAGSTSAASTNSVRTFVIDPAQSTAKYVVEETLQGVVDTLAVGTTSDVSGQIHLTSTGLAPDRDSSFKVDLRTLRSDESQRDNYVRQNTLQTDQYPFAEFVARSISSFPSNYVEGTEVELELTGDMTIHGVTKPVTFTVLARQGGNTLTAAAQANFKFTDFGMSPPNVRIAQAEDEILVEIVFVATEINAT